MPTPSRQPRGFTMIELAVVIAIIAVVVALAWSSLAGRRPRADLATASGELQALIHGARQQALASGHDVVVAIYPAYANPEGGVGRVVVLEDATFDFFTAGAKPNFDDSVADQPAYGTGGQLVTVFDLPRGVLIGPVAGRGKDALPKPWDGVAVDSACSFCLDSGDLRGAIRFDLRGRASFFKKDGPPLGAATGQSLTLTAQPAAPGYRTVVISASGGAVQTFNNG